MRRWAIPRWPTAFWTAWCTMRIGSSCPASLSARGKAGVAERAEREVAHEYSPVDPQTAHRMVRGGARSGPGHDIALRRSFQALPALGLAGEPAYRAGGSPHRRVDAGAEERSGLDRSWSRRTVPRESMRVLRRRRRD